MLTISQLAGSVGVTVRAVRHYHALGLLPEPGRDKSGYRRYDAQAVVALTRIKTLAEAGVPLSRVEELLDAPPARMGETIAEVDANIGRRIRELQQTRRRLRQLESGERLYLPANVAMLIERLRSIGISEQTLAIERDGWILLVALYPAKVPAWVAAKDELLDDEEIVQLYLKFDEAAGWAVDDPRLHPLARDTAAVVRRQPDIGSTQPDDLGDDRSALSLVNSYGQRASPAWTRLQQLIGEELKTSAADG